MSKSSVLLFVTESRNVINSNREPSVSSSTVQPKFPRNRIFVPRLILITCFFFLSFLFDWPRFTSRSNWNSIVIVVRSPPISIEVFKIGTDRACLPSVITKVLALGTWFLLLFIFSSWLFQIDLKFFSSLWGTFRFFFFLVIWHCLLDFWFINT